MGYYFKKSVLGKLSLIIQKLNTLMANDQEIIAMLDEADKQTNEIAEDIQDLIKNQGLDAATKARLQAHVDKLKTVASTHTTAPVNPTPPTPAPPEEEI